MTGFDSAFEQVKILVEHFNDNEKMYLAKEYSEARVRTDFIDKFFTVLGWDVNHNVQLNPYEQEVSIERSVNVEGRQQKRADYAFFLAPNYRKDDVKFYVEAKKPARNLSNPIDYFQTCRYGWSAGTPLSILTDFEELHILDCRTRPDMTTILENKREYFHYKDYLDKEKFAKLYWLFSREAIANNSIEKYVEQLPKPRGKAVQKGLFKGGYQSIDEAFLEELDGIRNTLAKAFKKKNPHLGSAELTEMTQKTIDRLVFIRFLEDKQIEPDHYISEFGNSKTSWKDFVYASRKLNAKYNGIVFKKSFIDEKNFVEPSEVDFSSVCEELSHVNSPYNFDLIPIHILGSIYERFLGKVVVSTDKRVRIEEKPEVRKAGGVYYTPQYIVKYIVENTIGKLIDEKTPKEIAKLRFADISCGSGSFLITVFDKLLEYHKKFYQNNPKEAKSAGCYEVDGKWVLSLKQKQKILTNNIYGVDIDPQAVEVTQLSLYLKLLEDESNATTEETWVMFKEQILPSLSDNIICGNSLIGTDISSGTLFNWEEEKKLKPMNFEDAFPAIMKAGGFDAVVGNPPYALIGSDKSEEQRYFISHYSLSNYKTNTYILFLEQGIKLLKKMSAKLGLIIPKSLVFNTYFSATRKKLLTEHTIPLILEIKEKVFKDAEVGNSILFFVATGGSILENKLEYHIVENIHPEIRSLKKFISIQKSLANTPQHCFFEDELEIKVKVWKLEELCDISNGLNPGNVRHILLSDSKISENHKRMLLGRDIQRYSLNWSGTWVNYDSTLKGKIKLSDTKSKPGMTAQKKVDFALRDEKIYQPNKIMVRKTSDRIIASFDEDGFYFDSLAYGILKKQNILLSVHFILGLLNSKLINYLHNSISQNKDKVFAKILATNLAKLPICVIEMNNEKEVSNHDKVVYLVKQFVDVQKLLLNSKTDNEKEYLEKKCKGLDRQIDALVYELYGLTEEEIEIVEKNLDN